MRNYTSISMALVTIFLGALLPPPTVGQQGQEGLLLPPTVGELVLGVGQQGVVDLTQPPIIVLVVPGLQEYLLQQQRPTIGQHQQRSFSPPLEGQRGPFSPQTLNQEGTFMTTPTVTTAATRTPTVDGHSSLCEQMDGNCDMQTAEQECRKGMNMYNETLNMLAKRYFQNLNRKYCGSSGIGCCAPSGKVYKADIENSFSFALRNTILFESDSGTRKLKTYGTQEPAALRKFIRIMLKYIKPGLHIQGHTYTFIAILDKELNEDDRFDALEHKTGFDANYVIRILKHIQTEGTPNTAFISAEWQPAVSCHNIYQSEISECYPNFWQYTCGLWNIFHTITVSARTQFPVPADITPLELLEAIHGYVINFHGCPDCIGHFKTMYSKTIGAQGNSSRVKTHDDAILWLWCAHNTVNRQFTINGTNHVSPKYYWPPHPPFPIDCSDCWASDGTLGYTNCANLFGFNNTNPGHVFSKSAVLTYLTNTYSGPYPNLNLKTNNVGQPLNLTPNSPCPGPGPE